MRKKILLALGSGLLVVVLVEAGLWAWSPPWLVFENHVPLVYESHPRWGYRYRAGAVDVYRRYREIQTTVRIGSHGWRGDAPRVPKPEGVFRVLLVGDSHVACLEVQERETFGAALEEALRGEGSPEIEVVSLGLDGVGTDVERRILEEEGPGLEPDLVVLQVFRNDFRDVGRPLVHRETAHGAVLAWQTTEERRRLRERARRREDSLLRGLARGSMLVRAWRNTRLGKAPDNFLSSGSWFELQEDWEPLPERVGRVAEEIGRMQEQAREMGAGFALVSLPASWILAKEEGGEKAGPTYAARHLGGFLETEGIAFLDLGEPLRRAARQAGRGVSDYFHRLDSHPNAEGYRVFGQETARWLVRGSLIPAPWSPPWSSGGEVRYPEGH